MIVLKRNTTNLQLMPALKLHTIHQLVKFAKAVTQKGLLGELGDAISMDKNDIYLNTYIQAISIHDFVNELKKSDSKEYDLLMNCRLRHWADPRKDGDTKTMGEIINEMMTKNRCVTDCMATVARFIYEEIDEKCLFKGTKDDLKLKCINDVIDIKWFMNDKPYIVYSSEKQDKVLNLY